MDVSGKAFLELDILRKESRGSLGQAHGSGEIAGTCGCGKERCCCRRSCWSGGADSASVGSMGGFVHHGTAGWDILVSNSLLDWRNCNLNSPLTALVGKSHLEG